MSEQSTHPSHEDLAAYSYGQLPENKAAVIDDHISKCEPCCETIAGLTSDDTFVGQLQEARRLPVDSTMNQPDDGAESSGEVPASLVEHPRYEILGLIGKGGMGDVYKARHRMMKRDVALKVIKRQLVRRPEALDRFHREVTTAAQLTHPNIVTSYDAEQAGDDHFMVMEYVDGIDLSQIVKERGPLPVANACGYICQAAIGLQHAHELGMVHRDIKPHDLRVTNEGVVKVLDFGLASLAPRPMAEDASDSHADGNLTVAGSIMGTPDFISPEQAQDAHTADVRSDIYSLGMTLYFLLAGRPPFNEGTALEKLKQHAEAEPVPLDSLRDDLPEGLAAIVNRMIAKRPANRFASHAQVAEALLRFELDSFKDSNSPKASTNQPLKPPRAAKICAGLFSIAMVAFFILSNWTETVGDKLAKMQAPEMSPTLHVTPANRVSAALFTVEAEALDGQPAAICDIGLCRIALIGQDITRTRQSKWMWPHVSGPTATEHREETSDGITYFLSKYADGETKCVFHSFRFSIDNKMIHFGNIGHTWNVPGAPGLLILVDTLTGTITTQAMKPMSQRVVLAGRGKDVAVVESKPRPVEQKPTPHLRITGQSAVTSSRHATDYRWKFEGYDVGEFVVKLMLATNGQTTVVREHHYRKMEEECSGEIHFLISDEMLSDRQHAVNAELNVSAAGLSHVSDLERRKILPANITGHLPAMALQI